MKQGRVNANYDDLEYLKSNRTFPVGKTILLILIIALQIGLVFFGFSYEPKPQDLIHQYNVTVKPLEDGSLDIEYYLEWEALDPDEELTWVGIGMANENYSVYYDSLSSNISEYDQYVDDDGYVTLDLYFDKTYKGGDKFEFYFKINQRDMLCQNQSGYFYEYVPGWFNRTQVKEYNFVWLIDGKNDYNVKGNLDYGEYHMMYIPYDNDEFAGCNTVAYYPFDNEGAYNELKEDKIFTTIFCLIVAALLIIVDVYIVDSYMSYSRGRGFLSGHGYYVHTYGRTNPHYIRARDRYNSTHGGRFGGGGCACACACACAGGGRAGCSQKDTFSNLDNK